MDYILSCRRRVNIQDNKGYECYSVLATNRANDSNTVYLEMKGWCNTIKLLSSDTTTVLSYKNMIAKDSDVISGTTKVADVTITFCITDTTSGKTKYITLTASDVSVVQSAENYVVDVFNDKLNAIFGTNPESVIGKRLCSVVVVMKYVEVS